MNIKIKETVYAFITVFSVMLLISILDVDFMNDELLKIQGLLYLILFLILWYLFQIVGD